MGSCYVDHSVRPPQDRVVSSRREGGHTAFVSPTITGYTVVYDQQSGDQDPYAVTDLGRKLSASLAGPVAAFLNHDDVLCHGRFEHGKLIRRRGRMGCPARRSPWPGRVPAAPGLGDRP
jgi:hypothetical protein